MSTKAQPADISTAQQGVLSYSQTLTLSDDHEIPHTVPMSLNDKCMPDRLLRLTARLGLPLYYYIAPPNIQPEPLIKMPAQSKDVPNNPILNALSIKKSPITGTFLSENIPGNPRPVLFLARADGKDLESGVVTAMWVYANLVLKGAMADESPIMSAHDKFHAMMAPEEFVEFFETFRDLGWGDIECPVKLGCCKACDKEGDKLFKCGKCGVVKYCGQECQKGDWAAHKKVCVKG